MLKSEVIEKHDSVEELFCKEFEKLKQHPMSVGDTEFLLRLMMSKKTSLENCPLKGDEKPFLYQLIEKRIEHCFTYKITDSRLIMFLVIITKSAGTAVMYMAYLQYWCKKHDIKEIDLDIFCEQIFPMGFPIDDDLRKLWYSLKVSKDKMALGGSSDNLLDYQTAYKSIQFN